jgi:hypothetical protein
VAEWRGGGPRAGGEGAGEEADGLVVSVNAFWRHLPHEAYHRKDLYGNRDLVQVGHEMVTDR